MTNQYVIVATREWYGPRKTRELVSGPDGAAARFASPKDARAYVEELDNERYYTAHNEATRPAYQVRREDTLPTYLTWHL